MNSTGLFLNVKTVYRHTGQGQDVILLHGWGQNMSMMKAIEDHLSTKYSVYNIDLPCFGESDMPETSWSVDDYVRFLEDFVEKNGIKNPIIVGHSFGCRIALKYASKHDVKMMCLTGAAGIRPSRDLGWYFRTYTYKLGKWFLIHTGQEEKLKQLQSKSGSTDYKNADGVVRETFVKVVNDDVTPILSSISCPVLLVWGEYDDAVPLEMGKKMESLIPNAALVVFENDDHYAYWHQSDRFNRVLDAFFEGEQ